MAASSPGNRVASMPTVLKRSQRREHVPALRWLFCLKKAQMDKRSKTAFNAEATVHWREVSRTFAPLVKMTHKERQK